MPIPQESMMKRLTSVKVEKTKKKIKKGKESKAKKHVKIPEDKKTENGKDAKWKIIKRILLYIYIVFLFIQIMYMFYQRFVENLVTLNIKNNNCLILKNKILVPYMNSRY